MPQLTDNETVKDRVSYAFEEYETEANKYRTHCNTFRDSSTEGRGSYTDEDSDDEDDTDLAEGGIMHLRTNIQTKQAFTTMNHPDFYLIMRKDTPPGYQEIAKAALTFAWSELDLTVVTRKAYLNRSVGGMGIVSYRIDEVGYPEFDIVRKSDFAPDPHVSNWQKLRYAAVKIKMPRNDFEERYPKYARMIDTGRMRLSGASRRKNSIPLKLYWDNTTECVLYNTTIIDKDINHYGKVPLIFLRGDLSPDRQHDTGDYENGAGIQAGLTLLTESLHNQAQHGGGINIYNSDVIPRRKLVEGRQNGWIDAGAFMDRAIKRIDAEPLNPALITAIELERNALDEATGVSAPQRGGNSSAKFATDLVIRANQSQGRADQERTTYEQFCCEVAKALRFLMMEFGNPESSLAYVVTQALSYISDLRVIERSTEFKDPVMSRNDAVQLFDKSIQAAGVGVPVDLVKIYLLLLRRFDLQDVEQYLLNEQALQQLIQQNDAMGGEAATSPDPAHMPPTGGGQLPPGGM